jgi:UDP-N-acetylmuramate: L-alanyl-gamma-D-glutamyl-meso-diaminopimelate ligase
LGLSAHQILTAISSFSGASKRLELLAENEQAVAFRDFAHAPSKLKATTQAVKLQFNERTLLAVFELHTYSSLNEQFLSEYRDALELADEAVVYYSRHALQIKRLPELDPEKIREGFHRSDLMVLNDRDALLSWLQTRDYQNACLLMMSSGNYDGIDVVELLPQLIKDNSGYLHP